MTGASPERALEPNYIFLPAVSQVVGPSQLAGSANGNNGLPRSVPLQFGVYPGGGTGEGPGVTSPSPSEVNQQLRSLAGKAPLLVHLYTAWSWYDASQLDSQVNQFAQSGFKILLTVKYSPPSGHDGDVAGYQAFLRSVVDRYGPNPAVASIVVGNEANVFGDPNASDGPFLNSQQAVVAGVIAAHEELLKIRSSARLGFNFAVTNSDADGAFLGQLAQMGGSEFTSAVQFVGINVYPGLWPAGTGNPYVDTQSDLAGARASVNSVADLRDLPIDILEIGAPSTNEQDQANKLTQIIQATLDNYVALHITSFNWFDLWDANSQSSSLYSHYGLSRSDLSSKPAFQVLQQAIAANQG